MCDTEIENLINLSIEDTDELPKQNVNKVPTPLPLIASPEGRFSFDNNPFDLIQKQSIYRQDDPFDVVEKEASLKARQSLSRTNNDVKLGNLLSLSTDNEFVEFDSGQASCFNNSTIYRTAEANDLENESPPITLSSKWTPESLTADSGGSSLSCDSSDSGAKQANGPRNRKQRHFRNRLLKISITNSSNYGTPSSSRKVTDSELNVDDMIASESPLKSMYEDIASEQAPDNVYSEKDFDADLEMMQIPMLNQIRSSNEAIAEISNDTSKQQMVEEEHISDVSNYSQKEVSTVGPLPDIESIRLKLRTKRLEPINNPDIQNLIGNLKTLICESTTVGEEKKQEVNGLLETLSSAFNSVPQNKKETITRQGTFTCDDVDPAKVNTGVDEQPPVEEEIPDIMMRSSATYDGETAEDKEYLNLPQIDPLSPPKEKTVHPNFNAVVEQLQYLLEQHQLGSSKEQTDSNNTTQMNGFPTVGNNPTFIVVMPTISHEDSNDLNELNQISTAMRRRSQSLSIHDKLKIVQLPIKPSADNKSPENYSSPPNAAGNTSILDEDSTEYKTPARFLQRRNSFSNTTPHTPLRYSRYNKATVDKERHVRSERVASPFRRLSIMETHNESQPTKTLPRPNLAIIKPDLKKKVKTTTTSIMKSNGPLKATLPMKNIAPNIKNNTRLSTSNTSMHMLAKSGHISNTSTPMPDNRPNGLKGIGKAIQSAYSTPAVYIPSPNKFVPYSARYSMVSTTPIKKVTAVQTTTAAISKRRTMSEFKAKSPMKTRSSGIFSSSSSGSALTKTNSIRSNQFRPNSNLKTSISTRASLNDTNVSNRNKENKKP